METSNFFDYYFKNSVLTSVIIMDMNGIILDVNGSFTHNFGYTTDDLKHQNFHELFTPVDRNWKKPEEELEIVLACGHANDENFVLHKNGEAIWCTGESVLAEKQSGEKFIIKSVVNLQARKYLNLFLKSTEDFLDRIFHSAKDVPMMIVNGNMKVEDVNEAFLNYFQIEKAPVGTVSLTALNNSFWSDALIRNALAKAIVTNVPLDDTPYSYKTESGKDKTFRVSSKTIFTQPDTGRRIYLTIDDFTNPSSTN